ncbi:hypothetical protein QOZ80_5AG0389670 [Eleusine coracana subsp. coracana]|nr:hypothetical protein QOZ80_5AG0389670 [Eleusine coracana subsp. coracana]
MTAFLVSASTGVMNSLLCKLGTLLSDEYKLLKGVRKEIGILRDELSSMNSLLQKLVEADELDVQKKEWRNKVRELAYDIEDCIDIFMHQLFHSDSEAGFIRKAIRRIRKLRARHQIAVQIQELKIRVMEESARRDRYNLDVPTSSSRLVDIDPRLPALYTEAKSLVGIDSSRDEIIQWLTNGNCKCCLAEQVNVVSILGFGGVGKTTLARQVYYQIKDRFQCTAFVSVSQTPDVSRILSDILSQIGSGRMRIFNDQKELIEKIREQLSHKRDH